MPTTGPPNIIGSLKRSAQDQLTAVAKMTVLSR